MNNSKIKNIILIILAALNLVLLALLIITRLSSVRESKNISQSIVSLYSKQNIVLHEGVNLNQSKPVVYRLRRNADLEKQALENLIGTCTQTDMGGNVLFYQSEAAQCSIHGTGDFDILVVDDKKFSENSRIRTAESAVRRLTGNSKSVAVTSLSQGKADEVICCNFVYDSYEVINAGITFSFSGDMLTMISGTLIFDDVISESRDSVIDSPTAAVEFLREISEQGYTLNEVYSIEPVLYRNVTILEESTLLPYWQFETDCGFFYINALTGKFESLL